MSIDYYGNGQHILHVDEATIEDDNGTFTCLALNAAGRVQITADVFVHDKGNAHFHLYLTKKRRKKYLHALYVTYSLHCSSQSIEVIDIPKDSPLLKHKRRILRKTKSSKDCRNMDYDHHNERNSPNISPSVSSLQRNNWNDNEEKDQAKRVIDRFTNDGSSKLLESK